MAEFICPVCKKPLFCGEKTYSCRNGHSFDISKKGYVNLLSPKDSRGKPHGDDKEMVKARRDFLGKGYYAPLKNAINDCLTRYCTAGCTVLDAGCGEGYYTFAIASHLKDLGLVSTVIGVDISKNALELCNGDPIETPRAVASVFNLPLEKNSCDVILNIFSPYPHDEYRRCLKRGGILIRAIPMENHLFSLKASVYEKPYKNSPQDTAMENYDLLDTISVCYDFLLDNNQDIINLFTMTPYYYKTSREDMEKLTHIESLTTRAEFALLVYKRK